MQAYNKVFGIGLNKTGTSSLGEALKVLGFHHKRWSPVLLNLHLAGKHDQIFRRIAPYEAFEDWPWPLMVEQLLDRYGDKARFVLTRRDSPERWLSSLKRHARVLNGKSSPRKAIYGYAHPQMNEAHHIAFYQEHLERTRALFAARGLSHILIELCWDEGHGWDELGSFLNRIPPDSPFPHLNASASEMPGLRPDARRLIRALERGNTINAKTAV